jgi:hypothetical protein
MKKIILTVIAAALIAGSTATTTIAAEKHHARRADRAPVSQQYRNANDAIAAPSDWYSYTDGHALSAPAGR